MAIDFKNPEYAKFVERWEIIQNVVSGEDVEKYLIYLNSQDTSQENIDRNSVYRARAIFYRLSGQTVQGMIGSIFRKEPTIESPPELEMVVMNADGAGNSLIQMTKKTCSKVISIGRDGLLVSFPNTNGEQVSRADILSGKASPIISRICADQIINWEEMAVGSEKKLSLVVISEGKKVFGADGYSWEIIPQIRELSMQSGVFTVTVWGEEKGTWVVVEPPIVPTDSDGNPWPEIPFAFVGSETNDCEIDEAPMEGLTTLNIGHYRHSADFEDNVHYHGHAQPWMSGITQDHIDTLKKNNMYIGSPSLIGVPEGQTFAYASAPPNTLVRQAMEDKVQQMLSLGAKIVQAGSATKTATQVDSESEAQTSKLGVIADNVSTAYTKALGWCCRFIGANPDSVRIELSQEFVNISSSPQELQQIISGYVQGAIPTADYVRIMRRAGYFSDAVPDEDYLDMLPKMDGMTEV